jgi:hypothetical protein
MTEIPTPPLRIFTDRRFLDPGRVPVTMLAPLWGLPEEDPALPFHGRFDAWARGGGQCIEASPIESCDAVVYPQEWRSGQRDAGELGRLARVVRKPLLVFFNSDSQEPIPLEGALVFRTSFRRSTRQPWEMAIPGWCEDFLERYAGGQISLRAKGLQPVASYCGYGQNQPHWARRAWQWLRRGGAAAPMHPGQVVRGAALRSLERCDRVRTHFLIRREFWGGASKAGALDPELARRAREEYVQNLFDGDYGLCARGGGNFSYRLYETLCCGRIPLFIDTDCVLPWDGFVDWGEHCVWVDESQAGEAGAILADFHARISPDDFAERQRRCRRLWEEWIRPEAFFFRMRDEFDRLRSRVAGL